MAQDNLITLEEFILRHIQNFYDIWIEDHDRDPTRDELLYAIHIYITAYEEGWRD